MLAFLTYLPSLIGGLFGSINNITAAISNTKIAQINATTDAEKAILSSEVETLQARRDVMIAEAGKSKLNIFIRAGLALGPLFILSKVFIWDKVIGSFYGCAGTGASAEALGRSCATFTTDALDPNLWQVVMVVLGFYFLAEASSDISRMFAGKK